MAPNVTRPAVDGALEAGLLDRDDKHRPRDHGGDGDSSSDGGEHVERHFMAGEIVRDAVMGASDGLTVPFALAAGLSGASVPSLVVVTAGLAEVAAGAIAMGLGGYLAAKSEADHYEKERKREEEEIERSPETEAEEVAEILANFGLMQSEYEPVVAALRKRRDAWVDFMMRFELGLERPEPGRAMRSAATISLAYVVGGMIPLLPYMLLSEVFMALKVSVGVTLLALFVFGYVKGLFTGSRPFSSALQTTCIGALASAAAFLIARAVSK
ncbi:vacuolar iron transporter 1.2 [Selaginella moellendorffii]|nr:vacuolar iron transporter 1.2 [Selaginella moellendorffii]|eukprot:XP_002977784.2 vacuolar iron transporter 1.2 [Selaginella moellendorffii]